MKCKIWLDSIASSWAHDVELIQYCWALQNMYEDGDEEMKRTIAKAWTDARSGKTADPLKGYNWEKENMDVIPVLSVLIEL